MGQLNAKLRKDVTCNCSQFFVIFSHLPQICEDKRLWRVFNKLALTLKELLLLLMMSCHRQRSVAMAEQTKAGKNDRRTDFLMIRKKYSPHHLRGRFSAPLMGGLWSRCCVLASVRNESTQRRKRLIAWSQTFKEGLLPSKPEHQQTVAEETRNDLVVTAAIVLVGSTLKTPMKLRKASSSLV